MKKVVILVILSILTLLIVLPIKSFVNQTSGNPKLHRDSTYLVADGMPGPALPPKKLHRDSTAAFMIA
jgi:hypothetical protein